VSAHQPRSLVSDVAAQAWDEVYAYKAEIEERERLRAIAFRSYPAGSFGPSARHQMAESIEAFMALGRRKEI